MRLDQLKQNSGAHAGDVLFLTKPLGVGMFATAQKRGILKFNDYELMCSSMTRLNDVGARLAEIPAVHAITDVTGFGLAGHLLEVCQASEVNAVINFEQLPLLDKDSIQKYFTAGAIPGGTVRNYKSYGSEIESVDDYQEAILCDPQTSGGLLLSVDPDYQGSVSELLEEAGLYSNPIGTVVGLSGNSNRITFA